jgi:hypothetical protein
MCRKLVLTGAFEHPSFDSSAHVESAFVALGWLLLIKEDHEQARVLVAILVSVLFLALHLSVKPLRRCAEALGSLAHVAQPPAAMHMQRNNRHFCRIEDEILMTGIELALLVIYLCVLVIKTCEPGLLGDGGQGESESAHLVVRSICRTYGFGETASGKTCCGPLSLTLTLCGHVS